MADSFTVPEGYQESFRRLLPYMAAPLHDNPQVLKSLLIYLKLGGEKMARIAIDAFNVTQQLRDAEMIRQLREAAMLNDQLDESDEDEDEDEDEEDEADLQNDTDE